MLSSLSTDMTPTEPASAMPALLNAAVSREVVSLADEIVFVAVDSADAPMVAAAAQASLASILFVP